MKESVLMFLPLISFLTLLPRCGLAEPALPEPGPESAGLRLRLLVTPHPEGGKEGYDVQVDLINFTAESISLRPNHWRSGRNEVGIKADLEAAVSIESYPAIEPWLGQVGSRTEEPPEYSLKPREIVSLKWRTTGRHLKNRVSNPLEVQNPEFTEAGLYSVHASIVLTVAGRSVLLRSNEQLVPIGGSHQLPRHTYGSLWWSDEKTKTAMLSLGSRQRIMPGDRFLIQSGNIGLTWTLTITRVEADRSFGSLEPVRENPTPAFPGPGANAALIQKK
jgi:hypothetical protein